MKMLMVLTSHDPLGNTGRKMMIIERTPVSTRREAKVTGAGDYRLFAGWRSDPFFFDTLGAVNILQFTGDDFFTGKNVCGIVLEVPNSALGPNKVGRWHRTLDGANGKWIQADRGAPPSQSVFLTGEHKSEYLAAEPAGDARFVAVFAHSLEHIGGYTPEQATKVAKTLLPDILSYDPTRPAAYPANGRALTDDVMDVFLSVITNGKVMRDNVGPHKDLLSDFPYLGQPHKVRSLEPVAA